MKILNNRYEVFYENGEMKIFNIKEKRFIKPRYRMRKQYFTLYDGGYFDFSKDDIEKIIKEEFK